MTRDQKQTACDANALRIALVVSMYHEAITSRLRHGAARAFEDCGGDPENLSVFHSPGAFELISICHHVADSGDFDAVAALGCVIRGETTHDQHICQALAHGLATINATASIPVTFGVLTCQCMQQAHERSGGSHGNKGAEAMHAAIAAASVVRGLRPSESWLQ